MQRLERQYLQKQEIQGPLDKIGWLAHLRLHSVTENNTMAPLGKQGECLKVSAWAATAMEGSRGPSCFRWRANRAPAGTCVGVAGRRTTIPCELAGPRAETNQRVDYPSMWICRFR